MMTFDDHLRCAEEWVREMADRERFLQALRGSYSHGEFEFTVQQAAVWPDGFFNEVLRQGKGRLQGQIRSRLARLVELITAESALVWRDYKRTGLWPDARFENQQWREVSTIAAEIVRVIDTHGWFFEKRPTRQERRGAGS